MTVYIDRYPDWLGVPLKWRGGGHLLTSNIDELHKFAQSIGLRRSWFQDKTFPHYDCVKSKRELAISKGAVEVKEGEFPDDLLVKTKDSYEPYINRKNRIFKD